MEKVKLGNFGNIDCYTKGPNEVELVVESSDAFQAVENSIEIEDELTEEQINYLNDAMDRMARQMSSYLRELDVENTIFDSQLGYGQEIDNLVIAISADSLSKLR